MVELMIDKYIELLESTELFFLGSGKKDIRIQENPSFNEKNTENQEQNLSLKIPEKNIQKEFDNIINEVSKCRLCSLSEKRKNTVPGTGSLSPDVMVIGEAPGAEEDLQGLPFVGKAGEYLDKWLAAVDLSRDKNAFICNIIKCRPPGNRDPEPDECMKCSKYLFRQIELLKPKAILALGRIAARFLLKADTGIGKLRGKVYYLNNIPLIPTYHPAGVLRNPQYRKEVWEDLRLLRNNL